MKVPKYLILFQNITNLLNCKQKGYIKNPRCNNGAGFSRFWFVPLTNMRVKKATEPKNFFLFTKSMKIAKNLRLKRLKAYCSSNKANIVRI